MEPLKVGDLVGDFSLPDQDGNLITLSELYARKNVLLVFNLGFG